MSCSAASCDSIFAHRVRNCSWACASAGVGSGGGGGGGSGISGITVQEEGSSLSTLATALNFVGSAVTATGSGATKTITISGGGSGTLDSSLTTALIDSSYVQARQAAGAGFTVQDEGSALSTLATTLNFTGNGVEATGTGATKTIQIGYSGGTGISLVGTTFNVTSTFTSSRATAAATTSSLADQASGNIDITAAKAYALLKIQTSHAAWVTLYTDTSSRVGDATRTETTDPLPGSGVIAEIITSDGATQRITPGTIGWNNDALPSTNVYVKVVNKSGSTADITVTLTYVQLEA